MNSGTFVGLASCAIGALMRMAAGAEEFIEGDYTYITNSLGQAVVTGFDTAYQGDLASAASLGGFPVADIGAEAFSACAKLTSAAVPDSVTNIGYRAFYNNGLLKTLVLGDAPALGGASVFQYIPAIVYYLPGAAGWTAAFGGRPTACWNPEPQSGATFGFAHGGFGFTVVGNADIPVRIDVAEDLASGLWTPIVNGTLGASGALRVDDPASPDQPSRFYRIAFP